MTNSYFDELEFLIIILKINLTLHLSNPNGVVLLQEPPIRKLKPRRGDRWKFTEQNAKFIILFHPFRVPQVQTIFKL